MQDDTTELLVYTDGGSRGNPGPAGVGVVLKMGEWVHTHGRCIGNTTNNIAEYTGLLDALTLINQLRSNGEINPKKVQFLLDSELVVKQVRGEYKVKDQGLLPLFLKVQEFLRSIQIPYTFTHVKRCYNKEADALVNAALDGVLEGTSKETTHV